MLSSVNITIHACGYFFIYLFVCFCLFVCLFVYLFLYFFISLFNDALNTFLLTVISASELPPKQILEQQLPSLSLHSNTSGLVIR